MRISWPLYILFLGCMSILMVGCDGTTVTPGELTVQISVSRLQSPIPLSVGVKANISGPVANYLVVWYWGDEEPPDIGLSASHVYPDPGVYTIAVNVSEIVDEDQVGQTATDWITVEALAIIGPPNIP